MRKRKAISDHSIHEGKPIATSLLLARNSRRKGIKLERFAMLKGIRKLVAWGSERLKEVLKDVEKLDKKI